LGNVAIKILHTPGHTPEHISLVVTDRTRSNEPWFVLTGHTLMVGDLGRTELATKAARPGARVVSERTKAQGPARLSGSLAGRVFRSVCGRSLSGKPTSTIGFERRYNKALQIEDEDTFVQAMLAEMPPVRRRPPRFARSTPGQLRQQPNDAK
jgi:glyoxylase-like metal-dependent hydrolase (beta-lactamase superfamily II)